MNPFPLIEINGEPFERGHQWPARCTLRPANRARITFTPFVELFNSSLPDTFQSPELLHRATQRIHRDAQRFLRKAVQTTVHYPFFNISVYLCVFSVLSV